MSQQGKRQEFFRQVAGVTSGSYTENLIQAAIATVGAPPGGRAVANEYHLELAKAATGGQQWGNNLPNALHGWSQETPGPPTNWSSAGDLSTFPSFDFRTSIPASYGGTYTCASASKYQDPSGVVRSAAVDEARFNNGLLLEVASENLLTDSEDFTAWNRTRLNASGDVAPAPDEQVTADKLFLDNTAASSHFTNQAFTTANNDIVAHSVYQKAQELSWSRTEVRLRAGGTNSVYYDIGTGAIGTNDFVDYSFIQSATDSWYRVVAVQDLGAGGTSDGLFRIFLAEGDGDVTIDGDGSSGFLAWGAQAEKLPYATSYMPSGSPRAVGVFTADVSGWYQNVDGYVLTLKGRVHRGDAGAVQTLAEYYDLAVEQNSVRIEITSDGKAMVEIVGANITRATLTSVGTVGDDEEFSIAVEVSTTRCALQLDSETPVTAVPVGGIIPTGINAAVHKADKSGGKEASMHLAAVSQQPGASL